MQRRGPRRCARLLPLAAALVGVPAALPAAAQTPPVSDSAAVAPAPDRPNRTRVTVEYSHVRFDTLFEPWNLASAAVSRRTRAGTVIGRVNWAQRFGESAAQVEADAYPRISERVYGFLNAAHAPRGAFPDWRFGAEVFANLPQGWEVSGGGRLLRFGGDDVRILTGSVGKYHGDGWTSLRPYVSEKEEKTSATVILTHRRYFADADEFVGLSVGYGSTPTATATEAELVRDESLKAWLEGSHPLRARLGWTWTVSYERETLGSGNRSRLGLGVGLRQDL